MILEAPLTCPEGVVYDDALHTYRLDGMAVPACSTVLKVLDPDAYAFIAAEVLERAATRGRNGHAMIALDCRDNLDVSSLDETLADHYIAWSRFRDDFDFVPQYSERVVASRRYGYCGTLDLVGTIKHKRRPGRWMIDAKYTAAFYKIVDIQTAGYCQAASESLPDFDPDTPRACLWISGDKYKFIECGNTGDRATFISARNILKWREKNGIR